MLLSHRIDKALKWVERNSAHNGGVCVCVRDGTPVGQYYEVSGYFIPTLRFWGKERLAEQYADWLAARQKPDGGWPGVTLAGEEFKASTVFDTAQIMAGMRTYFDRYATTIYRADDFLQSCVVNGKLETQKGSGEIQAYNVLSHAKALIPSTAWKREFETSDWPWGQDTIRTHYLAYALEGAKIFGWKIDHIIDKLKQMDKPYPWSIKKGYVPSDEAVDVCANFQLAWLLYDRELFEGMAQSQKESGGFPSHLGGHAELSWAVRYFLHAATSLTE